MNKSTEVSTSNLAGATAALALTLWDEQSTVPVAIIPREIPDGQVTLRLAWRKENKLEKPSGGIVVEWEILASDIFDKFWALKHFGPGWQSDFAGSGSKALADFLAKMLLEDNRRSAIRQAIRETLALQALHLSDIAAIAGEIGEIGPEMTLIEAQIWIDHLSGLKEKYNENNP